MGREKPETTEIIKYACNTYLCNKIIFANEYHDICQLHDVEWEDVKAGMIDKRINTLNMSVTEQRYYSGMCFPKDIKAIISHCKKLNYKPRLLMQVDENNERLAGNVEDLIINNNKEVAAQITQALREKAEKEVTEIRNEYEKKAKNLKPPSNEVYEKEIQVYQRKIEQQQTIIQTLKEVIALKK